MTPPSKARLMWMEFPMPYLPKGADLNLAGVKLPHFPHPVYVLPVSPQERERLVERVAAAIDYKLTVHEQARAALDAILPK